MGNVTLVVEFPDGNEPTVYARMNVLGGELRGVTWGDLMEGESDLLEAASDFLDVMDAHPDELVPINRQSSSVRLLREAIAKAKGGS